jgi:cation transport regulator ChaC
MTFWYFAYGSNMLVERLKARCKSARAVGTATAAGHALEFSKRSTDFSGKATLVANSNTQTPGVLFEIETTERRLLDRAEGAGHGYDRHDEFQVQLAGGSESIAVTTYLASAREARLKPYDWYLALVIAGASQHEVDAGYIKWLHQTEYVIDTNLTRESRAEALEALFASGFNNSLFPSLSQAIERRR